MLRRTLLAISSAGLVLAVSTAAVAAGNPSVTGQPSASCGSPLATMGPAGFNQPGFAIAEGNYAGSDDTASKLHSASGNAVSQYDVACYQITLHH